MSCKLPRVKQHFWDILSRITVQINSVQINVYTKYTKRKLGLFVARKKLLIYKYNLRPIYVLNLDRICRAMYPVRSDQPNPTRWDLRS